jgi:hypothetical protein
MTWSPTPPRFVRRWAVQGIKPDGNRATTIFDLLGDRRHIAVYPATVETFAVLIRHDSVRLLLSTINSRDAVAVPAWHAVHGARLLGLSPHQGGVELYVLLPQQEMHIRYVEERLDALTSSLSDIDHFLASSDRVKSEKFN